jgi:gamma-glutamylcyclotransferase (GGCT)/AIG2-like uncharacterized protein YtfP
MPMTDPEFVFVYGSLMRGLDLHHFIEAGTYEGNATADGVLVSLGRYPGLVDGRGCVNGELYRFDDLPSALDLLDDIEEFDATDPDKSLYLRVSRTVRSDDGRDVDAWLYVYNRPVTGAPRVEGGDWRNARP